MDEIMIDLLKIILFIANFALIYVLCEKVFIIKNKSLIEIKTDGEKRKKERKIITSKFQLNSFEKGKRRRVYIKILKLNQFFYYLYKVVPGALGIVLTRKEYGILCIGFGILGYFLIDLWGLLALRDENRKIKFVTPDIYELMSCQISASVPFKSTLYEIYRYVKYERLKTAFIELSADININMDIEGAIERFRVKFYNEEINLLCATIIQSNQTGKFKESLISLSKVARANNYFILKEETKRIEFTISFSFILIIVGIVSLIIFSFSKEIIDTLKNTFM